MRRTRSFTPEKRARRIRENVAFIRSRVGASTDDDDLHVALWSLSLHPQSTMWHDTAKEFRRQVRDGEMVADWRPHSDVAAIGQSPVGHSCVYCQAPAEQLDHVWPRSRGGDDHPNNLVWACRPCNGRKSGRSILGDTCLGCGTERDPGDVDTARGCAFYACRCGRSWSRIWDFQRPRYRAA